MISNQLTILDGGLATELEARGIDLSGGLWSAKCLAEHPQAVLDVHRHYLLAGADVITSASYQATIPGFINAGMTELESIDLLQRSIQLACDACRELGRGRVAASIGPYGAYLANGAEYTGNYDLSHQGLLEFHQSRWEILSQAEPDLLLCETVPSLDEACALAELVRSANDRPVWVSFSCRDSTRISDGTPIAECAAMLDEVASVQAIGVNCTPPALISELIDQIKKATGKPILVYPNSGEQYDAATGRWTGSSELDQFSQWIRQWWQRGASIIGGCCRTTPEHIQRIADWRETL